MASESSKVSARYLEVFDLICGFELRWREERFEELREKKLEVCWKESRRMLGRCQKNLGNGSLKNVLERR
jgi:hypothetical protein